MQQHHGFLKCDGLGLVPSVSLCAEEVILTIYQHHRVDICLFRQSYRPADRADY